MFERLISWSNDNGGFYFFGGGACNGCSRGRADIMSRLCVALSAASYTSCNKFCIFWSQFNKCAYFSNSTPPLCNAKFSIRKTDDSTVYQSSSTPTGETLHLFLKRKVMNSILVLRYNGNQRGRSISKCSEWCTSEEKLSTKWMITLKDL